MNDPTLCPPTPSPLKCWKYDVSHGTPGWQPAGKAASNPSASCLRARKTAALSLPSVPVARPARARLARYRISAATPIGIAVGAIGGVADAHATDAMSDQQ